MYGLKYFSHLIIIFSIITTPMHSYANSDTDIDPDVRSYAVQRGEEVIQARVPKLLERARTVANQYQFYFDDQWRNAGLREMRAEYDGTRPIPWWASGLSGLLIGEGLTAATALAIIWWSNSAYDPNTHNGSHPLAFALMAGFGGIAAMLFGLVAFPSLGTKWGNRINQWLNDRRTRQLISPNPLAERIAEIQTEIATGGYPIPVEAETDADKEGKRVSALEREILGELHEAFDAYDEELRRTPKFEAFTPRDRGLVVYFLDYYRDNVLPLEAAALATLRYTHWTLSLKHPEREQTIEDSRRHLRELIEHANHQAPDITSPQNNECILALTGLAAS